MAWCRGELDPLNLLKAIGDRLCPTASIVLPDQIAVSKAHEAFQPDGSLKDPKQQAGIEALGKTLASFLLKLKS